MRRQSVYGIILGIMLCASVCAGNTRFVVVILSYNNERWCQENIKSACEQRYNKFRVIYIDDCSSDNTGRLVRSYISEARLRRTCMYVPVGKRRKKMANFYWAVHTLCADDEVVVELDGDDMLAYESVLARLDKIYRSGDVWLTYGQYKTNYGSHGSSTGCAQISADIIAACAYRQNGWAGWPLRTFKAALFKKIKKEDLMYDGEFFDVTADLAYMFPLFEMAGTHARFISEVLYIYNTGNPLSDGRLYKQRQQEMDGIIRSRARYAPLERLV